MADFCKRILKKDEINYFTLVNPGRYEHISDSELLELYHNDGNREWIGILLERYTLLLLGVCMKYLKNEEESKDAVQQIFLKVLTDVSKYQISFFKSWLYMVAKNYCLMKLRDAPAGKNRELNEQFAAEETAPREDLLKDEKTYDHLEEAIHELNEEQKQCVVLFYLQKNSYQQVCDKTGFSMQQVKSYIQNGKRNLRILVEKKQKQRNSSS
jgi:RNA polymerase sigma-70 factor (ECF subfamily)